MENVRRNFFAFLWHGIFLALAATLIDMNTVTSSLILEAGGKEIVLGLVTAIFVGVPLLVQLIFASFLSSKNRKKPFLLLGIYMRVFSLAIIGILLISPIKGTSLLVFIIVSISIFSFSGVFAGVSYTDLLGKSIPRDLIRKFMSYRQILRSIFAILGVFAAKIILKIYKYPKNYSVMFLLASLLLGIASIGFWLIRENYELNKKLPSFWKILKSVPGVIVKDKNLRNYVFFSNFTGFGLIIAPFYVLLARKAFPLPDDFVGNFLLFQMVGIAVASFFWGGYLGRNGYRKVLNRCVILGAIIPILALILSYTNPYAYSIVFLLSGFTMSARQMSFEGVLIEITTTDNRALYIGISGALNLVTALLPLIMGILIKYIGFSIVFLMISFMVATSLFFLKKISNID
jgi:hypothetical protein